MSRYWYQLKIANPVFNTDWVRPTVTKSSHIWIDPAEDVYDHKWLLHVQGVLGILLGKNMTFYNDSTVVQQYGHIDVYFNDKKEVATQYGAINWVEGGAGSEMVWFKPKPDASPAEVGLTEAKTLFTRLPLSSLEKVQSLHLTGVTLVRTDVPHYVTMGDEERWAFSIRPQRDFNYNWERLVDHLDKRAVLL